MTTYLLLWTVFVVVNSTKNLPVMNNTQHLLLSISERQQFENNWPPILWPDSSPKYSFFEENQTEHGFAENYKEKFILSEFASLLSLEDLEDDVELSYVYGDEQFEDFDETATFEDIEEAEVIESGEDGFEDKRTQPLVSVNSDSEFEMELKSVSHENREYINLVINTHLEDLVVDLYAFMNVTCFRLERFRDLRQRLSTELTQLKSMVDLIDYNVKSQVDQLSFAMYVFTVMDEASEILARYHLVKEESHWVIYVIQLHIRMLMLPHSRAPSSSRDYEYANVIKIHIEFMLFWVRQFKYIANVPLTVRLMLESHLERARVLFSGYICSSDETKHQCTEIENTEFN